MTLPLVIAHRAQTEGQEPNCLSGLERCLVAGLEAVEIDLRLQDGTVVLAHDRPRPERRYDPLSDAVPFLHRFRAVLFDLKEADAARPAAVAVKRAGLKNVMFCSTRLIDLRRVLDVLPGATISYSFPEDKPKITSNVLLVWIAVIYILVSRLLSRMRVRRWSSLMVDIDQFTFSYRICSRRLIEQGARLGKPIMVWTVNDPRKAAGWIKAGAAAVITDYPLKAKAVLAKNA